MTVEALMLKLRKHPPHAIVLGMSSKDGYHELDLVEGIRVVRRNRSRPKYGRRIGDHVNVLTRPKSRANQTRGVVIA